MSEKELPIVADICLLLKKRTSDRWHPTFDCGGMVLVELCELSNDGWRVSVLGFCDIDDPAMDDFHEEIVSYSLDPEPANGYIGVDEYLGRLKAALRYIQKIMKLEDVRRADLESLGFRRDE